MDYKHPDKTAAVWDKFCTENKMDKANCRRWFQSQRVVYVKITHVTSGQGAPHLTDRQN